MKMIATKTLRYGTRSLRAGDEFEASPRDARVLQAIGKAGLPLPPPAPAPAKPRPARARLLEAPAVITEPPPVAEDPPAPALPPEDQPPSMDSWKHEASEPAAFPAALPAKRTYTRRDLLAE